MMACRWSGLRQRYLKHYPKRLDNDRRATSNDLLKEQYTSMGFGGYW